MPGVAWVARFIRDHNIKVRKADNVKPERANLSTEQVEEYFQNLEKELEGVPPTHVFNFDETNFADDPKKKTVNIGEVTFC